MAKIPKEEMLKFDYIPPKRDWLEPSAEFRPGTYSYTPSPDRLEYLDLPNPRKFDPAEEDWALPENWKEIILEGMKDRLEKYRSLRLFMDICVRCGACADKCHFFIGSGDPKNMPVLRAELLRSVYRKHFTTSGKLFGKLAGARELTYDTIKEWFYYFYQCTECRRCAVFCPYGIDTAEITMIGRDLLNELGCNTDWILTPVRNSFRTGNHLGVTPHAFKEAMEDQKDDVEDVTGIRIEVPINKKGVEVLYVPPSGDYFGMPHWFGFMGQLMLLHEIGLDYTVSTFASEGGNFGSFLSMEMAKRLNAKIYEEAKRLKVKWILGGECGHMWGVIHQLMDTFNGPADFLEEPVSPITGTKFENAKSTRMVHICEFTADLIKHGKLRLDPSRNKHWKVTYHDSCNPSRRIGLFEEPRYILRNVLPPGHFYEMPENTIRERTFCCGSGSGIGPDENMEMRLRGGFPRANAVKYVHEKYGVNLLVNICAIDRASFPPLLSYWVPGVETAGLHELVGNALVMRGEKERTTDLRFTPIKKEGEGK